MISRTRTQFAAAGLLVVFVLGSAQAAPAAGAEAASETQASAGSSYGLTIGGMT